MKIAILPRSQAGGWLAPTLGAIEFLQHLTQVSAGQTLCALLVACVADHLTISALPFSQSLNRCCIMLSYVQRPRSLRQSVLFSDASSPAM